MTEDGDPMAIKKGVDRSRRGAGGGRPRGEDRCRGREERGRDRVEACLPLG